MKVLGHRNLHVAKEIHKIQKAAYSIESDLIGFRVPYMDESIDDLIESIETFFGIFDAGQLMGFIAVEQHCKMIQLSRLCVHPNYFGKGYGKSLIRGITNEYPESDFFVTTARKNKPAISLYEACGFLEVDDFLIEECLEMVKLVLKNQ